MLVLNQLPTAERAESKLTYGNTIIGLQGEDNSDYYYQFLHCCRSWTNAIDGQLQQLVDNRRWRPIFIQFAYIAYLLFVVWNKARSEGSLAVPHYECATPLIQQVRIDVYHTVEHKQKILSKMKFISSDDGSFQYYRLSKTDNECILAITEEETANTGVVRNFPTLKTDEVYVSCTPPAADSLSLRVSECADAISTWMKSNRLQLNPNLVVCDRTPSASATYFCSTHRWQSYHPSTVRPWFGIYIDAGLSMRMHVQRAVSRCFTMLRQLRQICRCVPATTFQMLVVALVHSQLDYGNSVLVGIPVYLLHWLQSVLNVWSAPITSLMCSSAFIGWRYWSAYNTRSPCWVTESFTVAHHDTWDCSHASPTFLVDGPPFSRHQSPHNAIC